MPHLHPQPQPQLQSPPLAGKPGCWVVFIALAAILGTLAGAVPVARAAVAGEEFFESRIRPLLADRCYECHNSTQANPKGGLVLDWARGMAKGGDSGPVIVPGKPGESLLIRAVTYKDPELRMPPEKGTRKRLNPSEVQALVDWVAMGAPDPRTTDPSAATAAAVGTNALVALEKARATNHWAFQPLRPPVVPIPAPGASHASRDPIDAFILARLRAEGLAMAPEANRATLIRRLTLDLTGVPPTAEEVDAFVSDPSDSAYARLVDRLLASERHGERWGRWWLDIARYADTNGQDENKVLANAWRYRDWVVNSFNANTPLDRFILEQLAGDLLDPTGVAAIDHARLVATGFLVLGPKMLAEQDKPKLVMDIVDEQVDTVGRAFLGLTLGCARCHDHKFDPVPTRDYYAMAGIFRSTRTMENLEFVSKFNERWLAPASVVAHWTDQKKLLDSKQKELDGAIRKANESLGKPLPEKPRERYPAPTLTQILALESERDCLKLALPPEPPRTLGTTEGTVTNLPVHIRGNHLAPAKEPVPRGFVQVVSTAKAHPVTDNQSGRLELARWIIDPSNPLTARVLVNRVWQAYFGEGLVRSPDNFGLRGEPPTHPELLDHLADSLIRSGWDLKALHRRIVLSNVYRQSSTAHPVPANDPGNRWLSVFPRRRMEAEMIRDSLLAVSGQLDRAVGGSLVSWENNEYTPGDTVSATSRRRTLYLPVVRDRVYDVLTIFDFANPSVTTARRGSTIVPHQALFFMNSPLVKDAASAIARQLLRPGTPETRALVIGAYRAVLQRSPAAAELEQAERFLAPVPAGAGSSSAPETALAEFCQVLLASNEFIYRP